MLVSSHFKKICEYGKSHGQCRCMGPHTVITVPCDRPEKHRPLQVVKSEPMVWDESYVLEPLADRLDKLLCDELWWMQRGLVSRIHDSIMEEINK